MTSGFQANEDEQYRDPQITMTITKVETVGDVLSEQGAPTGYSYVRVTLFQYGSRLVNEVVFAVSKRMLEELFVGRSGTLTLGLAARMEIKGIEKDLEKMLDNALAKKRDIIEENPMDTRPIKKVPCLGDPE